MEINTQHITAVHVVGEKWKRRSRSYNSYFNPKPIQYSQLVDSFPGVQPNMHFRKKEKKHKKKHEGPTNDQDQIGKERTIFEDKNPKAHK